jgi:Tn7-like transposition protein D/TniQ
LTPLQVGLMLRGKLLFFPAIREDELLYSVLARWGLYTAAPDDASRQRALFGVRSAVATVDLPNRLEELNSRIPNAANCTARSLAMRHTLLPYYAGYTAPDRAQKALSAMSGSSRDVHLMLGIVSSRVPRIRRLRFCQSCNRENLQRHGEIWWRRLFQLPAVLICPEHIEPLCISDVDLDSLSRHHYAAATLINCPSDAEPCCFPSPEQVERLLSIVNASELLLKSEILPTNSVDIYRKKYIDLSMTTGLMRTPKALNVRALEDAFKTYWEPVKQLVPELLDEPSNWVTAMFHNRHKTIHPLQHIMLEAALMANDHTGADDGPFGPGPWVCLNRLADHYDTPAVTVLNLYKDHDKLVGRFTCSCGYVFTRGVSEDGLHGPPRYRNYGPMLRAKLIELGGLNLSMRAISRILGLDAKTVAREMALAGIDNDSVMFARAQAKMKTEKPSKVSTTHRKRRQAKIDLGPTPRRDWAEIDLELESRVGAVASQLNSLSPPKRRTFALLEWQLAGRGYVRHRMQKLPRTAQAILAQIETEDAFRIRRFEHWRDLGTSEGRPLRLWDVAKRLSLTPAKLSELLNRHGIAPNPFR